MKLQILFSLYQTLLMVLLPGFFSTILGIPLGIVLFATHLSSLYEKPFVHKFLEIIVNTLRSIPFIILLVLLTPLTRFLIGSSIGTLAAVIPLTVSAVPFLARLIESSLNELNVGLIEAATSMGASKQQIIIKVLIPEAMTGIISAITTTLVNLVGYSAIAGVIGGGGLGDLAIRYGYQRSETDVMFFIVLILVVLVQLIQFIGDKIFRLYSNPV